MTVARRWLIAHMHEGSPRVIPDRSRRASNDELSESRDDSRAFLRWSDGSVSTPLIHAIAYSTHHSFSVMADEAIVIMPISGEAAQIWISEGFQSVKPSTSSSLCLGSRDTHRSRWTGSHPQPSTTESTNECR